MRNRKRDDASTKVKVCTAISGTLLFLVLALSVYGQMPNCAIESIDHPLWGVLCLIILFIAAYILIWGWRSSK